MSRCSEAHALGSRLLISCTPCMCMPVYSRNYSLDTSTFDVVLGPRSCTGTFVQLSSIYSASLYTLIVTEKRICSFTSFTTPCQNRNNQGMQVVSSTDETQQIYFKTRCRKIGTCTRERATEAWPYSNTETRLSSVLGSVMP